MERASTSPVYPKPTTTVPTTPLCASDSGWGTCADQGPGYRDCRTHASSDELVAYRAHPEPFDKVRRDVLPPPGTDASALRRAVAELVAAQEDALRVLLASRPSCDMSLEFDEPILEDGVSYSLPPSVWWSTWEHDGADALEHPDCRAWLATVRAFAESLGGEAAFVDAIHALNAMGDGMAAPTWPSSYSGPARVAVTELLPAVDGQRAFLVMVPDSATAQAWGAAWPGPPKAGRANGNRGLKRRPQRSLWLNRFVTRSTAKNKADAASGGWTALTSSTPAVVAAVDRLAFDEWTNAGAQEETLDEALIAREVAWVRRELDKETRWTSR